ncbi:unnamed protein product [Closterium sp. NIES-53]
MATYGTRAGLGGSGISGGGGASEIPLWQGDAEREQYESFADLYAIIKTTEKLEKAYVRDLISPADYEPACAKLIGQFRTLRTALQSAVPDIERFMTTYKMDCPAAKNRLLVAGVPATVEHKSATVESGSATVAVAETVQHFITAMDTVKLNMLAVDQLNPPQVDPLALAPPQLSLLSNELSTSHDPHSPFPSPSPLPSLHPLALAPPQLSLLANGLSTSHASHSRSFPCPPTPRFPHPLPLLQPQVHPLLSLLPNSLCMSLLINVLPTPFPFPHSPHSPFPRCNHPSAPQPSLPAEVETFQCPIPLPASTFPLHRTLSSYQ